MTKRVAITLMITTAVTLAAALLLPLGTEASHESRWVQESGPANVISRKGGAAAPASPAAISPDEFLQLTPTGARLPQIAANGTYTVLAYQLGSGSSSRVWLRSATSAGWGLPRLVDSRRGEVPQVAFWPGNNRVHLIWEGDSGRTVRHTYCDLAGLAINCAAADDIQASSTSEQYSRPDIVVDAGGQAYAAWVNRVSPFSGGDNRVETARLANGASTWAGLRVVAGLAGGDVAGDLALATAGDYVHLAFADKGAHAVSSRWSIEYWRYTISSDVWGNNKFYQPDVNYFNYNNQVLNPAIAATGSSVYMAWAGQKLSPDEDVFALLGALSSDFGVTWPSRPMHIPSKNLVDNNQADEKISYDTATPLEETGLRPSLAVSTTNTFAMVWQQHYEAGCGTGGDEGNPIELNGTSEISYTLNSNDWMADKGYVRDDRDWYSIDPDLAVDANGNHLAYMRAPDNIDCFGGDQTGYAIYYHGPYQIDAVKYVHLPVVRK